MGILGIVLIGIVLVLITLYIIIYVIYPGSGNKNLVPNKLPLSQKKEIYYSDETQTTLLKTSGSTVMGFFKLQAGDRTQHIHSAYIPILQIANAWQLEVSPSPASSDGTTSRLRVFVKDGAEQKEEFIELPSIPLQKWTFIAVLRDGRRFDVIYDNRIVASQRLANYPVATPSPLSIGNTGVNGTVIHVFVNPRRLSPSEVEKERRARIDTNGAVLEDNDFKFPGSNILAVCPPGLPCNTITRPPPSNLMKWSTPYA
jgi:hypothetical protein